MTAYLNDAAALDRLMDQYDRRFPDATPFQRDSCEYEYRKALADIYHAGIALTDRGGVRA